MNSIAQTLPALAKDLYAVAGPKATQLFAMAKQQTTQFRNKPAVITINNRIDALVARADVQKVAPGIATFVTFCVAPYATLLGGITAVVLKATVRNERLEDNKADLSKYALVASAVAVVTIKALGFGLVGSAAAAFTGLLVANHYLTRPSAPDFAVVQDEAKDELLDEAKDELLDEAKDDGLEVQLP